MLTLNRRDGPYWWNPQEHADTPHRVKVNEARLVDGMIPLSNVMVWSSQAKR